MTGASYALRNFSRNLTESGGSNRLTRDTGGFLNLEALASPSAILFISCELAENKPVRKAHTLK